jgi:hypothetical protein
MDSSYRKIYISTKFFFYIGTYYTEGLDGLAASALGVRSRKLSIVGRSSDV